MPDLIGDVHSHPFSTTMPRPRTRASPSAWTCRSRRHRCTCIRWTGTAILSMSGLGDTLVGREGRKTSRRQNEARGAGRPASGRSGAFAVVPKTDMDAANPGMANALGELKLDGISTAPHRDGAFLGGRSLTMVRGDKPARRALGRSSRGAGPHTGRSGTVAISSRSTCRRWSCCPWSSLPHTAIAAAAILAPMRRTSHPAAAGTG